MDGAVVTYVAQQIQAPESAYLEARANQAFDLADLDGSGEITLTEMQSYAVNVPQAANFLEYWDGCLCHANIPPGTLWVDKAFGGGKALYRSPNQ